MKQNGSEKAQNSFIERKIYDNCYLGHQLSEKQLGGKRTVNYLINLNED